MKYLVVSDNHGDRQVLVDLVATYRGKVDGMFHCGDSELEPTDELWQELTVVTGNCDYDSRFLKEQLVTLGTDTIYMTHGHLINVRGSLDMLLKRAKDQQATIALYGHTHELTAQLLEGILVLNPGSIRLPRGKYSDKTYALIEQIADGYEVQYYNETHKKLPDLHFTFTK